MSSVIICSFCLLSSSEFFFFSLYKLNEKMPNPAVAKANSTISALLPEPFDLLSLSGGVVCFTTSFSFELCIVFLFVFLTPQM
ncbi:hypothetical protein CCAN2_1790010 [Capnocytophaga canimorsus]|nr:hypothetical protein CCAN2_1790010 [Capnocytophaga canimorsus]